MLTKSLSVRSLVIVLLVIGGIFMESGNLLAAPKSVADINANPQVLSGLRFSKGDMSGLNIQNAHIKGLQFDDIQAPVSRFTNVTFENCSFTKVNFQSCRFENVAFKNCQIQGRGNHEDINNSTIFRYSVFKDVLFENTKMNNVIADSISGEGGYVYFRNMREVYTRGGEGTILSSSNLHCRVVDSNLTKAKFLVSSSQSASFYAKNSKFSDLRLQSNHTYIEKCSLNDIVMYSTETAVVTKCLLDDTKIASKKAGYYVNNQYIESGEVDDIFNQRLGSGIEGRDGSPVYVMQSDTTPVILRFTGGQVTACNITLKTPILGQFGKTKPPLSLNLRNVRILGGNWSSLELESGNWENVTIEPPLRVKRVKLNKIQAYNLEFPKGDPWKKEGEFSLDITRVFKPFDWPEVRVPTPEDMGLEWWPSEPGYHQEK